MLLAEFRLEFPEFSNTTTYPDTFVDRRLIQAWSRINEEFFGEQASYAHGYLTAHLLKKFPPATVGGGTVSPEVKSVTAGRASITYVTSVEAGAMMTTGLESTEYGRMYLEIVDRLPHPYVTTEQF